MMIGSSSASAVLAKMAAPVKTESFMARCQSRRNRNANECDAVTRLGNDCDYQIRAYPILRKEYIYTEVYIWRKKGVKKDGPGTNERPRKKAILQ